MQNCSRSTTYANVANARYPLPHCATRLAATGCTVTYHRLDPTTSSPPRRCGRASPFCLATACNSSRQANRAAHQSDRASTRRATSDIDLLMAATSAKKANVHTGSALLARARNPAAQRTTRTSRNSSRLEIGTADDLALRSTAPTAPADSSVRGTSTRSCSIFRTSARGRGPTWAR